MATLTQRLEKIIINLKVISKLEVGQRLLFKNKSVSIRNHYMFVTPVIRLIAQESRDDVTEGLNELVEDINRLVADYLNSSELQNPNASEFDRDEALTFLMSLNRLKIEMPLVFNENRGLNAAKETYASDPGATAKIEGVIDNLKLTVRKVSIAIAELSKKFGLDGKLLGVETENKVTTKIKQDHLKQDHLKQDQVKQEQVKQPGKTVPEGDDDKSKKVIKQDQVNEDDNGGEPYVPGDD